MTSAAVPLLISVNAREPALPTAVVPNATLVAGVGGVLLTVSAATPPVPVPDSATVAGLPAALCAIVRFPLFAPSLPGVKVTLTVQLAPADNIAGNAPQLLPVCTNCVASPLIPRLLSVSDAVPLFLTVRVCVLEVPSACGPKSNLPEETASVATPPVPLPISATTVDPTLCAIERLALFIPSLVGVNVTFSVQFAPAARVAGKSGQPLDVGEVTANCCGEPDIEMLLISSAAVPPLLRVSVRGVLVVPTP
jgi:hypothetical protein